MKPQRSSSRAASRFCLTASLACAAFFFAPARAEAQSATFYLDRLQIGGAPGDGLGVWRPGIGPTRVYGQLALGYAYNPLRADTLIKDPGKAGALKESPLQDQLTSYFTVGGEFLSRGALQVTLPLVLFQKGFRTDNAAAGLHDAVDYATSAPLDLRVDGRVLILANDAKSFLLSARASLFLPTGDASSYAGDVGTWGNIGISTELNLAALSITLNGGVSIRPPAKLDEFTVGSELTYGLAVYVPVVRDRLRVGAEVFGSTGLLPQTQGTSRATPLEWSLNGKFFMGQKRDAFLGLGVGTRLTAGYAPDARVVASVGGAIDIEDDAPVERRPVAPLVVEVDTDKDGVADIFDQCPIEPEDDINPGDGCPEPPDRDHDGIVNARDACPDQAEDKDGIDDEDGCPEVDADGDGFADALDKCPKEPGVHGDDPEKEGCPQFIHRVKAEVQLVQQIEFEFGISTILPNSYPILDEIVKLLATNPDVKLVSIDGHTDDVGTEQFNDDLSQARADAVRDYLVKRGKIDAGRLSAKGFGRRQPLAPNDTPEGRAKNRRVEFHIVKQATEGP